VRDRLIGIAGKTQARGEWIGSPSLIQCTKVREREKVRCREC
jgi:hypothetical protein